MLLSRFQQHDPDIVALFDAEHNIRYGDLEYEIQKRAEALASIEVLGLILDNSVEWVLWDLAALKAGVPCVPLPPFFTADQTTHVLHTAGVTHLLSPEGLHPTGIKNKGPLPKGTAKVTFTSGTTGTPKGVCLPESAMENVASGIADRLGEAFTGIHTCILPLAVLLENVAGVYAALIAGCTVHLTALSHFGGHYEGLHDVLKRTGATSAIFVPEILRTLMAQSATKGVLPDLKFTAVGGSKVDPALIGQARMIGIPVYEGYGLSECASVVSMNIPGSDRAGSVGKPLPHVQIRIADGEIQIKNPGFLGYIGEDAPGIFKTGDLGEINEEGFLFVTGRKKNVLITSYGRNISPEWVEATLLTQPAIAQALIYGDAKPHLSALLVPSSPAADLREAVEVANQLLPDYAQIRYFTSAPPFTAADGTLTGTGRPRRDVILNLYAKETDHEFLQSAG
ncbi:MAG: AMP-binding protein [Alphaproteobacteria bacterium]|nr:AMP-binding protein [Alphaproteobacteria bacterium]